MASIRHSPKDHSGLAGLPDFRNLGLVLRLVLLVNGAALLAVLLRGPREGLAADLTEMAARVEPPLILCLSLLHVAQPLLEKLDWQRAWALVLTAAFGCGLFSNLFFMPLGEVWSWAPGLWSLLLALISLHYLSLRSRALSPALSEARLLALTARIRPHFLFNSLNAVLGILRSDPRRAELALEELAELFRAMMKENRDLVRLGEEIGLSRQYLNLEKLRLGERLSVRWDMETCPPDALVPPLMLQPILENAVRHGIEPGTEPGEILIRFARQDEEVRIEVLNPWHGPGDASAGNRMALDNVRERLMLFYDLEARIENGVKDGQYRVAITLPYRKNP